MTSLTSGYEPEAGIRTGQTAGLTLAGVFPPNCIETIRRGTGKSSVISLLVNSLAIARRIECEHAEEIIRRILEHERLCSTGYGKGFAFPHLRTASVTRFVGAIGVAPDGVNFRSPDQAPAKLIFLTLSPLADRELHCELLSRLVNLMQDKMIRLQLGQAARSDDLYSHLCDIDKPFGCSSR